MRSRKLLAFLLCLITGPALAGYMTLLGAGLGAIQPAEQATFTNSSYSTNLSNLTSVATFSRAGNATQFDSSGYLTYGPNQLLLQNTNFSDPAWAKNNVTITGGQADPVGGSAAARLQGTVAASWYMAQTANSDSNALIALWVKSNTGSNQSFRLMTKSGSVLSADLTATTSWQQFNLVGDNSTGFIGIIYGSGGATVDLLVYKATLSAVTYETTPRPGDQVITTASAYYGPRFDYTYNGSSWVPAGLLIEGAATNLALQSNTFISVSWNKSAVAVAQNVTGPDGVANSAWTATASAGTAAHAIYQSSTSLTVVGNSVIAKAGTANYLGLGFDLDAKTDGAFFNLTSGTVGTVAAGATASIQNLGGGWYRCFVTRTYASGTHYITIEPHTADAQVQTWNAAGTETIIIYGAQLEAASVASSYIPTAAASVTRAADVVQFTGAALAALQGANGTAIVEYMAPSTTQSGAGRIIGTTSSRALLYGFSDTVVASWNGSRSLNATIGSSGKFSTIARTGASWSAAGTSLVGNGGTVATDANTAFGGVTPVAAYLASDSGSTNFENGWYRSVAFYTSRLPDATLQAKSVVGAAY